MSTIAALGSDGLWMPGELAPQPVALERVRNAGALFNAMALRQPPIDVLYVHRSALEAMGLPLELEPPRPGERRPEHRWVADARVNGQGVGRCLSPSITAAPAPAGGPALELVIGAWQDGAGDVFGGAADARELCQAAVLFALAFATERHPDGWLFRHSAMTTGWRLMHGAWAAGQRRRKGDAIRAALHAHDGQVELEGVEPGVQAEVPYGSWTAPARVAGPDVIDGPLEQLGDRIAAAGFRPYAAGWDVNGQRLAACSRLELGIGEPVEVSPKVPPTAKVPGYHLVTSVERPHGDAIPPIFEPGWHTSARVAMADYLSIGYELERSIVWPEHVAYLDPFYAAMREARGVLLELARNDRAAAIALGAVKQAYLQPLGRLRSHRARERGDLLYRPAWYDAVIGQELAREYLRLHQLADDGEPVLAVYFDAIICETDSPDASDAPAALELSDKLGKFKPIGTVPAGDAQVLLWGDTPRVGELIKLLKAGGRGEAAPPAPASVAASSAAYRPAHGGRPVPTHG